MNFSFKIILKWWRSLIGTILKKLGIPFKCNGSQLKNPYISGAIFTLNLSKLILNSKCVEGARDVRVLRKTPIINWKIF